MPLPPSAQLFANTGLSNNPILSSLLFLSQRRQDTLDQQKADEDRQRQIDQQKVQEQRQKELLNLQKGQFDLQKLQSEQQLKQQDIQNRLQQANFKYKVVPEALLSGAIPTEQETITNPTMDALGLSGGTTFNTGRGGTYIDPVTGEEVPIDQNAALSIMNRQRQIEQQANDKIIKPILLRAQLDQINDARQFNNNVKLRAIDQENDVILENLRAQARRDAATIGANAKERAAYIESGGLYGTPGQQTGIPPIPITGRDPVQDKAAWSQLTPAAHAVATGLIEPDNEARAVNSLAQYGLQVPPMGKKATLEYKEAYDSAYSLVQAMEDFNKIAPEIPQNIFAKGTGAIQKWIASNKGNEVAAAYDQMRAFIPKARAITGMGGGNLSDRDLDIMEGILTGYVPRATRESKIRDFKKRLETNKSNFFSPIQNQFQREEIMRTWGFPKVAVDPMDALRQVQEEE